MTEDAPATGPGATPPPATAPTATTAIPTTSGPAPATTPPPPPYSTTTMVGDTPPPPSAPVATPRPSRPGMGLLPIAIGVGLLAAAIVLASARARSDGDLDWSNYVVGLGATAVLLLVALAAILLGSGRARAGSGRALAGSGRDRDGSGWASNDLATWPGVVGILGAASMLGVGLEGINGSNDWLAYLIGAVVVVLAALGYLAVRRGAFVVTAIAGLGLVYTQLSDDVILDIGGDDDWAIIGAATIAAFVLVVTAVGWLLPTRALSGVVVGVVGLVGINAMLIALAVTQFIGRIFGDFSSSNDVSSDGSTATYFVAGPSRPDYDNDVYVILAIAAVLVLLWALAASLQGNPGFTVLAILMTASVVPIATVVLAVEHPTWWGVGLGVVGAVLLAAVGLRQLSIRRRSDTVGPAY